MLKIKRLNLLLACLTTIALFFSIPESALGDTVPERLSGTYMLKFLDFTSGSGLLASGTELEFVVSSDGRSLCVAGFQLSDPAKSPNEEYTWLEDSLAAELELSQYEAGGLFEIVLTANGIRQGAFTGERTGPGGSCGERNQSAINLMFQKAEQRFPGLFNPLDNAETIESNGFISRTYTSSGITISVDDNDYVYLSGGVYGSEAVLIDELFEVIYQLDALFEGWTLIVNGDTTESGGPPIIISEQFVNILPPEDPSDLAQLGDVLRRSLGINSYESGLGTDFGTQTQTENTVIYSMRFNAFSVNGLDAEVNYELSFNFQR